MEDYQVRVYKEKDELQTKYLNLEGFIFNDKFLSLDINEQERLFLQYYAMRNYRDILTQRIENFR